MRVEFSRRAVANLRGMAREARAFGRAAAEGLEIRMRQAISRIVAHPWDAPEVEDRPGVHVLPLIRYPYRIFYRVFADRILILHIRHAARRPWMGGR